VGASLGAHYVCGEVAGATLADSFTVGGSGDDAKVARGGDFSAIRILAEADAVGAVVVAPVGNVGVGVAVRNEDQVVFFNASDGADHLVRLHGLTDGRGGYEERGDDKNLHGVHSSDSSKVPTIDIN
jgi:hypothetical protein